MSITVEPAGAGELEADLLVVPISEGARELPSGLNDSLRTRLAPLVDGGEVTGAFGEATLVHVDNGSVQRVSLAGLGKRHRIDADSVRTAMTASVRQAKRVGGTIAWLVDESLPVNAEDQARAAADGVVLGEYDPGQWR